MTDRTANSRIVFAVDCDRTLTGPDLEPDPQALFALAELRKAGFKAVLVTGRSKADLERFPARARAGRGHRSVRRLMKGDWRDDQTPVPAAA